MIEPQTKEVVNVTDGEVIVRNGIILVKGEKPIRIYPQVTSKIITELRKELAYET